MNKKQTDSEQFKKVLSETTRALSKNSELIINFESDVTKNDQNHIRLTRVSSKNSKNEVLYVRGEADSIAMHIRYHDKLVDKK